MTNRKLARKTIVGEKKKKGSLAWARKAGLTSWGENFLWKGKKWGRKGRKEKKRKNP
jgi:hypothetical protein